jgi:hypothetical protein
MDEETADADKSIYIIEDSQLDIGLLVAVERNVNRILQIIADYLSWNEEKIEESKQKPEQKKTAAPFDVYEESAAPEKKKGLFGKIKDLFKRKKKVEVETPALDYMMIYGKPHKLVKGKWVACTQEEFDAKMAGRHEKLAENKEKLKAAREEEKAAAKAEAEAAEEEKLAQETAAEKTSDKDPEEHTQTEEEPQGEELANTEQIQEDTLTAEEEPPAKMGWFARKKAAKAEKAAAKAAQKAEKQAAKELKRAEKAKGKQNPEEEIADPVPVEQNLPADEEASAAVAEEVAEADEAQVAETEEAMQENLQEGEVSEDA